MAQHINELILKMEKRKGWIGYMKLLDELRKKHEIKEVINEKWQDIT